MEQGPAIVAASVWLALMCYPAGLFWPWVAHRARLRALWSLGGIAFAVHVVAAFEVHYRWSHAVGIAETARQTEELTGVASGAGLWLNYLFALIWAADMSAWWLAPRRYLARGRRLFAAEHLFLLFMIFNATVIFESGAVRLLGLLVTAAGTIGLVGSWRRMGERA